MNTERVVRGWRAAWVGLFFGGVLFIGAGCERSQPAGSNAQGVANAAADDSLTNTAAALQSQDETIAWLVRYGYLPATDGISTASTSKAVRAMQTFYSLEVTGIVDARTREAMSSYRCGLGDFGPLWEVVKCPWQSDSMSYAFDRVTADVPADEAKASVRRAFDSYARALAITFREVAKGDSPDVLVHWVTGSDPDFTFAPTDTAHADFPPGCRRLKGDHLPVHFKDRRDCCQWSARSDDNGHDIESVALHEIGHLLGLAHSLVRDAVMFPELPIGSRKRALHADDLQGLRELYPTRMR